MLVGSPRSISSPLPSPDNKIAELPNVYLVAPVLTDTFASKMLDLLYPNRNRNGFRSINELERELPFILDPNTKYDVYISNGGTQRGQRIEIRFATDGSDETTELLKRFEGTLTWRAVQEQTYGADKLTLIDAFLSRHNAGAADQWSLPAKVTFLFGQSPLVAFPRSFYAQICALPDGQAEWARIEKRLEDWRRFLDFQQKVAKTKQFIVYYDRYRRDGRQTLRFTLNTNTDRLVLQRVKEALNERIDLVTQELSNVRSKQQDVSVENGIEDISALSRVLLGNLSSYNASKSEVEIELDEETVERLNLNLLNVPPSGVLCYTALGELSQIDNLNRGLNQLKRGQSANKRLVEFMFDPSAAQTVDTEFDTGMLKELERADLLQGTMNSEQMKAVKGVLARPDLFLIQGPPGTGKTTVIAEICYQFARQGMRTLIASQSNLAVDNALSRLVDHPSIRALRRGHADRVEEEGKPYLEENVIQSWLDQTKRNAVSGQEGRRHRIRTLKWLCKQKDAIRNAHTTLSTFEDLNAQINVTKQKIEAEEIRLAELRQTKRQWQEAGLKWTKLQSESIDTIPNYHTANQDLRSLLITNLRALSERSVYLRNAMHKWMNPSSNVKHVAPPEPWDQIKQAYEVKTEALLFAEKLGQLSEYLDALLSLFERRRRLHQEIMLTEQQINALRIVNKGRQQILEQKVRVATYMEIRISLQQHAPTVEMWLSLLYPDKVPSDYLASSKLQALTVEPLSSLWLAVVSASAPPLLHGLVQRWVNDRKIVVAYGDILHELERFHHELFSLISYSSLAQVSRNDSDHPWHALENLRALLVVDQSGQVTPSPYASDSLAHYASETRTFLLQWGIHKTTEQEEWILQQTNMVNSAVETMRRLQKHAQERVDSSMNRIGSIIEAWGKQVLPKLIKALDAAVRSESTTEASLLPLNEYRNEFESNTAIVLSTEQSLDAKKIELSGYDARLLELLESAANGLEAFAPKAKVTLRLRSLLEHQDSTLQMLTKDALTAVQQEVHQTMSILNGYIAKIDTAGEVRHIVESLNERFFEIASLEEKTSTKVAEARTRLNNQTSSMHLLTADVHRERATWGEIYRQFPMEWKANAPDLDDVNSVRAADIWPFVQAGETWEEQLRREEVEMERCRGFTQAWIDRLEKLDATDDANLRRIYIDNANVIGITCVQAGSREFAEEYREFDCVIVDEVSKATPPELILPMLKGKQIVLVGDHKQLPPMIGHRTIPDLAKDLEVDAQELAHLERSLFKELFEQSAENQKIMLITQYRMHEQIMRAVNRFYQYQLECGVTDSDRKHGFSTPPFHADKHIYWISTPNQPQYYETSSGTSRMNLAEVDLVAQVVKQLAQEWAGMMKLEGLPRKKVGVISFYSAQIREIKKRLDSLTVDHAAAIDLRLGTVDRFQGMESEVIIVSLVCNNKHSDIGFAEKQERVNVALSRAREMLVIIGSQEHFIGNRNAGRVYNEVAGVVNRYGGTISAASYLMLAQTSNS